MPICEHVVSYRNGSQIMVGGLKLKEMGYGRGAQVQITDVSEDVANVPWLFVVQNDEHATLACRNPEPPPWIQPGVRIRIDVRPASVPTSDTPRLCDSRPSPVPTAKPISEQPVAFTDASALPTPNPALPPRVIYAVDVGKPEGGLAWARLAPHVENRPRGSTDYELFLDQIAHDLRAGLPVALGFEAPLFLPVASRVADLTRARRNEPGPWSFGSGAYVTTVAIPLMALTLRHLESQFGAALRVSLDAEGWLASNSRCPNLLLWEAYVFGPAHCRKPNSEGLCAHVQDAATAVRAFVGWEAAEPRPTGDVTANHPISTVGAAVLWAALGKDVGLLHQPTLVLRPQKAMGTDVGRHDAVQVDAPSAPPNQALQPTSAE